MAAGAAAAVCGARIGSRIAKTGSARRAMVTAQDDVVDSFHNIFIHCHGNSQERLQRALMRVPQTTRGAQYCVNYPTKEDLLFMTRVADIDRNGEVSDQEACFAFRVWLCWKKMYPKISAMFDTLDSDGNGTLDASELEPYLCKLNDDELVLPAEVESVIRRADSNGDRSLDKHELTFATAVWYTDIDRKKVERKKMSARMSRASIHAAKVGKSGFRRVIPLFFQCCSRCIRCGRRPQEDCARKTDFCGGDLPKDRRPEDDEPRLQEDEVGHAGSEKAFCQTESFSIGKARSDGASGQKEDDVTRSSTASPASTADLQRVSSLSDLTSITCPTSGSSKSATIPEGEINLEGICECDLDELVQAKLALARSSTKSDIPEDKRIRPPERITQAAQGNKELSSTTTASTIATASTTASGPSTQSEFDMLEIGYHSPPCLMMMNKSNTSGLTRMHEKMCELT